jgi:protein-S-isoprenylcysteine O-methyltransferase Ste14
LFKRLIILLYGLLAYGIFLGTFLYAIGFVGNLVVPKAIDTVLDTSTTAIIQACLVNVALLGVFAVQHTIMARPAFKKVITTLIPQATERSTFVLGASASLLLLYWKWQALPGIVWQVGGMGETFLTGLFWLGWIVVLLSTFMLGHFELFGLKQVILNMWGKMPESQAFKTPWLYNVVRHPIMLGFMIAFWATPVMTVGHLLFAVVTTAYIYIGVLLEERDLVVLFGDTYRAYQKRVPMLLPFPRKANFSGALANTHS